jgi:hypothetical protein
VVLQAALIHPLRRVLRAVVGVAAVDVGGVEAGEAPAVAERAEVGVVGQDPVYLDGDAGADRMWRVFPVHPNDIRVAGGGLEHDGRSAGAAGLHVEHHAAAFAGLVLAERVLIDEGLRAAQARLLGVGEQQHDVVAGPGPGEQSPGGLEDRRDPGAVVVGARPVLHRVVVRHEDDPAGRGGAVDERHYVADPAAHRLAVLVRGDRDRVLDPRLESQPSQGADQVFADGVVGRAARDVGGPADPLHMAERPSRAELAHGGVGAAYSGRHHGEHSEEAQGKQQGDPR